MPDAARRFELDPRFDPMWKKGAVTVFRFLGQSLSLKLAPKGAEMRCISSNNLLGFPCGERGVLIPSIVPD